MGELSHDVIVQGEERGDVLIVRPKGRFDALSSPMVEKKVFEFIRGGHQRLLMNLSGVDYLSSAGMRMLLSISKKLKTLSGKLVLCGMTQSVLEVLKMSGFDQILEVVVSEEDGIKLFTLHKD